MNNSIIRNNNLGLREVQSYQILQFINEYELRKHQYLNLCPLDHSIYGSKESKKRNQALIALNSIAIHDIQIKQTASVIKQISKIRKQKFTKQQETLSFSQSPFHQQNGKNREADISKQTESFNQPDFQIRTISEVISNQSSKQINFNDLQSVQASNRLSGSPIDDAQFQDYQSSADNSQDKIMRPVTILQDPNQSDITEKLILPPQYQSFRLSDKSSLQFYLKLQNFQTKQSALIKNLFNSMQLKTTKMLVFNKIKELKWQQLDLPKPQVKYVGNLNYAKII